MIDWTRINELKEELGEEDFAEVFTIFLDEVQDSVDSLTATPSGAELESILHSVKGNALTVGFSKLADLASVGEVLAGQGKSVDLDEITNAHSQSKAIFAQGPP